MKRLLACGLLLGITGCPRSPEATEERAGGSEAVRVFDFESGRIEGWSKLKLPFPDSAVIVDHPVREGRRAIRFQLRRADRMVSKGKRAELELQQMGELGHEYWYGFSIHVPSSWQEDFKDEVVTQWNATADIHLGENEKRSPPLAIRIRRNEWMITSRWDPRRITPPGNDAPKATLWKGAVAKGQWTDWVVNARWSWRETGRVRIWRNGEPIVDRRGPNTYHDLSSLRFKVGIYKPQWNDPDSASAVTHRVIYHDAIRVGGASASYEAVAARPVRRIP